MRRMILSFLRWMLGLGPPTPTRRCGNCTYWWWMQGKGGLYANPHNAGWCHHGMHDGRWSTEFDGCEGWEPQTEYESAHCPCGGIQ